MTNKQARSSCKPQILPCIHASTLDVLTNSFGKLDHHPVAEIQSRRTAYSRIHATSSSASSPTSPTRRGLGDATTWRLHSEPHPHGSSTPIRIKHNRDLHGSKSACMQANKEEVCVHVRAGQLQIAAALACAHAHMASSMLRPRPKWLRRASSTSTMDHVDHVSSGSAELRPHRPRTTSTTS